jgi:hypothetical protein
MDVFGRMVTRVRDHQSAALWVFPRLTMKHLALIFDLLGTLVLIAACVTMAPEHSVTVAAQAGEQAKPGAGD